MGIATLSTSLSQTPSHTQHQCTNPQNRPGICWVGRRVWTDHQHDRDLLYMQLHSFATALNEYREKSQHNFSSLVILPSLADGKLNRSTSDKDLNDSWTFLEDTLCLFASDSSSSKLGNNLFLVFFVDMVD